MAGPGVQKHVSLASFSKPRDSSCLSPPFSHFPLPFLTHLERLNIHYLHQQHVAWLCPVNVKRTSEIVDLGQIDIEDIISTIIVANLTTSPVKRDELGQSWSCFQIGIWIHVSIE